MDRRLLPLLLCLGLPGCSGSETEGRPEVAPLPLVRVAAAELQEVQREIRATGFLESEHQDQVAAMVGGRLHRLLVDEGAYVDKGALLAEIDDREMQSSIQQLRAQRDARLVDKGLAELEVEAAGRRVAQAEIETRRTRAEFERQSQINPEFVSPKALEDAELLHNAASEALKVSGFNERKAGLEVTRIGASIAELDARIAELEVRLEHHRVLAPFTGVITRRLCTEGSMIAAGTPLFDMVDPEHLVAYLDRPQAELDLVRQSRVVTFTTDALPGREFTADVDLVSPVVDRQTGHFRLRVRVRSADVHTLLHGMFVRARIRAEDRRMALMVPKAAVLSEGEVAVVMVARNGKACRVDLDPGLELQDWIESRNRSKNGLEPGDLVITAGHEDLKDQTEVRVAQ